MRLTRQVAIGIAVVCGTLAAALAYVYLSTASKPKQAPPPPPTQVELVVPVTDIPVNTIITEDMLVRRKFRLEEVPRGAIRERHEIVGYAAVRPLPAQKPILASSVKPRAEALGLAGVVPPGMRAVTVALDPVMGVAGLVKVGDRVDVVATFEVEDSIIAKTVLQDVEVLALGTETVGTVETAEAETPEGEGAQTATTKTGAAKTQAKSGKDAGEEQSTKTQTRGKVSKDQEKPTATLAVTPQDAQKLMLADQRGELRLALRPFNEHDFVPLPPDDMVSLVGPQYAALIARKKAQLAAEAQPKQEPPKQEAPKPAPVLTPQPELSGIPQAPPAKQAPPVPKPPVTKKAPEPKPPDKVLVIRGKDSEIVVP